MFGLRLLFESVYNNRDVTWLSRFLSVGTEDDFAHYNTPSPAACVAMHKLLELHDFKVKPVVYLCENLLMLHTQQGNVPVHLGL